MIFDTPSFAFRECSGLTSVTIGNGITSIVENAFYKCTALKEVYCMATTPPSLYYDEFFGSTPTIYVVDEEAAEAYKATNWNSFNIITTTYTYNNLIYTFHLSKKTATIVGCSDESASDVTIPSSITHEDETYSIIAIGEGVFDNTPWYNNQPDGVIYAGAILYKYKGTMPAGTNIIVKEGTKSITHGAFYGCTGLTSITIPNSVTSIGNSAFSGCTGLTSITIPESVTSIGDYAFNVCSSLTSITIPESVTTIGNGAFWSCTRLTSITIPNSVTSIGLATFKDCYYLTSITIGNSIASIDTYAFTGCRALKEVYCKAITPPTLGSDVFSSSPTIYVFYEDVAKAYRAAEGWKDYNITTTTHTYDNLIYTLHLGQKAATVVGCNDESTIDVTIPSSIMHEDEVYNVTSIENSAFAGCTALKTVYCEATTPPTLGSSVFSSSPTIYVFYEDVAEAYRATEGWKDYNITTTTHTYDNLIYTLHLGQKAATVVGCNDESTIEVTIPSSIMHEDDVYSVTSISDSAFANCTALNEVYCEAITPPTLGSDVFCGSPTIYVAEEEVAKAYRAAEGWKAYNITTMPTYTSEILIYTFHPSHQTATIVGYVAAPTGELVLPENVTIEDVTYNITSIGDQAFVECAGLTAVTIPNSVTTIGLETFLNCTGLTSVTIGNGVTMIGDGAFWGCTGLTSITIPESVTTIDDFAFGHCTGLTSITIPENVTRIGNNAFYGCTNLKRIVVDEGNKVYTSIDGVLYNKDITGIICCPAGLTSITIPESVTTIGEYAFYNCNGLTAITLPECVTTIGEHAFQECAGLTAITIPEGVTTIGYSAFSNCFGLSTATIGNRVAAIGEYAFYGCKILKIVYCEATTPPALSRSIFSSSPTIYVANEEAAEAYRAADVWKSYRIIAATTYTYENLIYTFHPSQKVATVVGYTAELPNEVTIPGSTTHENEVYSVTAIDDNAFYNCSGLTAITIPESVTTIGSSAFWGCTGLTAITIPEGVTTIGSNAFSECINLATLTLGSKVASIGSNAFNGCNALMKINSKNTTPPDILWSTFSEVDKQACVLNVPINCMGIYRKHQEWGKFYNINETDFSDVKPVIPTDNENNIRVENGAIVVTADAVPVTIYNMSGVVVYHRTVNAGERISLPTHGIYLVRVADKTQKVVL